MLKVVRTFFLYFRNAHTFWEPVKLIMSVNCMSKIGCMEGFDTFLSHLNMTLERVAAWFFDSILSLFHLQVIWNTSPNWSPGACWRCWWTNMSGPVRKQKPSPTSCFPCWSCSLRKEPQLRSACATPGSPSSGDLQLLFLPFLPLPQETATDHFPLWAYQNIYFSVLLFLVSFIFVINAVCLLCICWFLSWCVGVRNTVGMFFFFFVVMLIQTAVLFFNHPTEQTYCCTASDSSLFVTLLH